MDNHSKPWVIIWLIHIFQVKLLLELKDNGLAETVTPQRLHLVVQTLTAFNSVLKEENHPTAVILIFNSQIMKKNLLMMLLKSHILPKISSIKPNLTLLSHNLNHLLEANHTIPTKE